MTPMRFWCHRKNVPSFLLSQSPQNLSYKASEPTMQCVGTDNYSLKDDVLLPKAIPTLLFPSLGYWKLPQNCWLPSRKWNTSTTSAWLESRSKALRLWIGKMRLHRNEITIMIINWVISKNYNFCTTECFYLQLLSYKHFEVSNLTQNLYPGQYYCRLSAICLIGQNICAKISILFQSNGAELIR